MADELPPLPKPDLGSILVNREVISLGYSEEAMRAYAQEAARQEREACALACDALSDANVVVQNRAAATTAGDCASAIRSRSSATGEKG